MSFTLKHISHLWPFDCLIMALNIYNCLHILSNYPTSDALVYDYGSLLPMIMTRLEDKGSLTGWFQLRLGASC
jgi:hypothetical protein